MTLVQFLRKTFPQHLSWLPCYPPSSYILQCDHDRTEHKWLRGVANTPGEGLVTVCNPSFSERGSVVIRPAPGGLL